MTTTETATRTTYWICDKCGKIYDGGHQLAAKHFDELDSWEHWLFEFSNERTRASMNHFVATGREIHTSDSGGYYISSHLDEAGTHQHMALTLRNILYRYHEATEEQRAERAAALEQILSEGLDGEAPAILAAVEYYVAGMMMTRQRHRVNFAEFRAENPAIFAQLASSAAEEPTEEESN